MYSMDRQKTLLLEARRRDWGKQKRSGAKLPSSGKKKLEPGDIDLVVEEFCEPLIPMDLWERVQKRREAIAEESRKKGTAIRGKYLLSGFLLCGECGYSFVIGSASRQGLKHYRCTKRSSKGTDVCTNKQNVPVPKLESTVKGALDAITKDPDRLAELVEAHNAIISSANEGLVGLVRNLEDRIDELLDGRSRLAEAIKISASPRGIAVLTAQLDQGEEELAALEKSLGEAKARLQPIMAPSLKCVQDGSASLFGDDLDDNKAVLTEFLEEIVIFADGEIMIGFREESILGPVLGWAGDLGETIGKDGIYLLKTPSPEEWQSILQAEHEEAVKEWGPSEPVPGPSLRRRF